MLVIECFSRICTPALRALSSSLLTSPDPFRPRWGAKQLARDVPFHGLVGSAGVRRGSASAFLATGELDAVGQQELERGGVFVGELADDVAIAVTGRRVIVPGPIRENHVGRVHGAVFLLQTVPAAELDAPAAHDAPATDVEIFLDDDHGGPGIAGRARAREPRNPRTDHHHIRRPVPFDVGGLGLPWLQSGRRYGDTCPALRHSRLEEASPADGIRPLRYRLHGPLLNRDDGLAASRLWYEHDQLRGVGHQLLISWRKAVDLKNESQDVHIRLVA